MTGHYMAACQAKRDKIKIIGKIKWFYTHEDSRHGFLMILLGGEERLFDQDFCLHVQVRLADLEDFQHDKPPGFSCYE